MPLSTRLALELFLLRGTDDPAENAPFRKGGQGDLKGCTQENPPQSPFLKGGLQALTLLGETRPAPRVRDARIQRRG